ncbi:MAG: hypothetical protein ABIZ09_01910, partial [Rhodoferax sp.]
MDGELFYELLVSEIESIDGDAGAAYGLMLNAARKTNSPKLYERAIEIAYRARSGDAAVEAAKAWVSAMPTSREANRYQFQILLGLNKIADTVEPLKRELASLAPAERAQAVNLLPRYFTRTADKKLAASVVEKVLLADTLTRATGPAAWAVIGTMRLHAEDAKGALNAVQRGVALEADSEPIILLAVALIDPKMPQAEAIVRKYLGGKPTPEVRMAYSRALLNAERYSEIYAQMLLLTAEKPDYSEAWLLRGSIELQDGKLALAETSLKTYIALNPPAADTTPPSPMSRGL